MNQPWSRLIVELQSQGPDAPWAALLSAELFTLGAQGVETQDASTLPSTTMAPLPPGCVRLIAFFEGHPESLSELQAAFMARATDLGLEIGMHLEPFEDTSWLHGWKAFFKPDRISHRLAVRPPWETYDPPEGVEVLVIEPGMAFGTGLHETTRLCIRCLDELTAAPHATPSALLDVGCGSGVLSMAARRLGIGTVTGVDVDPIAAQVSTENAELNAITGCTFSTTPIDQLTETYPLVIANILAHILTSMRDALIARTAPGGVLVLSGLLTQEQDALLAHFTESGEVDFEARRELGEWSLLRLKRS